MGGIALRAEKHAAEAPAALHRDRHFHLDLVAGKALEIRPAHQRAVDPW
jgi:hypothetical protein